MPSLMSSVPLTVIGGFDRLREPAGAKPPVKLVLQAP
jgi:hypothetical protein